MSKRLDYALAHVALGFRVFPLGEKSKAPRIKKDDGGNGCHDATGDEAQVRAWWATYPNANIGVAAGDGLIIIDEDRYKGADLSDWQLPPTLTVRTAHGGYHHYFHYAGALPCVSEDVLAPHACIKAEGGYGVGPGSTVDGKRYEWIDKRQPVAELPEHVAELIRNATVKPEAEPGPRPEHNGQAPSGDAGAYWLAKAMARTRDGVGDAIGYWLAQQLLIEEKCGASVDVRGVLLTYAERATVNPAKPFTDRDVDRWIESASRSRVVANGERAKSQDRPTRESSRQRDREAQQAAPTPKPAPQQMPGVLLSEVQRKPIEWLWPGRLARGKPTIIDGDSGMGKSFITVDIVARVTRGRPMPGETERRAPMSAIMIAPEDDPADTVKPRLEAVGADMSRVRIVSTVSAMSEAGHLYERPITIPRDVGLIEDVVRHDGAAVLVIDPITGCLDAGVKTHVDAEVRMALTPLILMAQRTGVTIIMVRHLNKGGGEKAIYRGGGSVAFVAICRTAFLLAEHPDNGAKRVLAQTKNNIARTASSLSFSLVYPPIDDPDAVPHVVWDAGECDYDANALLSARRSDERREIIRVLSDADGPLSPTEIAEKLGIPEKSDAIRQRLSRMRKAGEIESPSYGLYVRRVTPEKSVTHVTVSQYAAMEDVGECDSVTDVTAFTGGVDVSQLAGRECARHAGEIMPRRADGSGYELCSRCKAEQAA